MTYAVHVNAQMQGSTRSPQASAHSMLGWLMCVICCAAAAAGATAADQQGALPGLAPERGRLSLACPAGGVRAQPHSSGHRGRDIAGRAAVTGRPSQHDVESIAAQRSGPSAGV
jgi:hypothetical protein